MLNTPLTDSGYPLKLFAVTEEYAAELRKLYPGVKVVVTPNKYPSTLKEDKEQV